MHFPASDDWGTREYSFSTYLIVASEWSYYGMSNGWFANSFPRYEEYSKPLGPPSGPAQRLGKGQYFRDFLHLNVSLDTIAKTATVTWKGGIPPPIRPPPACKAWNCSCQGMTDIFGELLMLCIHSLDIELF